MISENIVNQKDHLIQKIEQSDKLNDIEKKAYTNMVNRAAAGTNGLTPEQKLQNVCENTFDLMYMMISHTIDDQIEEEKNDKISMWLNFAEKCKWVIGSLIGLTLILATSHPEVVSVIKSLFNN